MLVTNAGLFAAEVPAGAVGGNATARLRPAGSFMWPGRSPTSPGSNCAREDDGAAPSTSTAACRSCAMCPSRAVAGDRADAAVAAPADPRRSTAALRVGTVATAVAAAAAAAAASRATVVTYWSGGGTIDRHKRGEDPSVPRRRHHRGRAGQPSLARQRTRGRCRRVG